MAAENVARRDHRRTRCSRAWSPPRRLLAMPAEVLDRARAMVPPGGWTEPSEVADLVAFSGSEQAGSVTGQAIGIDGGVGLNTQTARAPERRL